MEHSSIKFLKILANKIYKAIPQDLVGVYLHGSLAMNFFDSSRSDIDLLIVVKNELSNTQKEKIMTLIYEVDKNGPAKGVEMSVILEKHALSPTYPVPFLLHYSRKFKEAYLNDKTNFIENMNGVDKDLTAHIMVTYHRGIVLIGKPIKETFKEPNKSHYIDSIYHDVKYAKDEILQDPIYYTLNLLRVSAYLINGVILSKGEAIFWGKENIDSKYIPLLNSISNSFLNGAPLKVSELDLKEFATYSLGTINSILNETKPINLQLAFNQIQ